MNAYLHIPFCTSICSYCDFTSFAGQESKMARYLDALVREVENSSLAGPLQTVYFGGGTPSLVPPDQLRKVLQALSQKAGFDPEAEISMEANPETVDLKRLEGYRSLGINRLSFGAQAFQKEILKKLGRGHEWDRVEKAFLHARQAGFQNINLDLMFGLPGQTVSMFQASLESALALGPDHLSLYALQVEEGTALHRQVREGLTLPTEDETADEYAWAQEALRRAGFEQYEVSNFAREGKSCRHNWNIWRGEDYWGFGLSAVGTVKGIRHSHGDDLDDYIQTTLRGKGPVLQQEVLSTSVRTLEKLMLNFRTRDGVLQSEVEDYAREMGLSYENRFTHLQKEGFLSLSEGRYRVTSKGFFVLNGILESLVA
jgi:putative oxygen-independent coproporphyrinogen III oxidase